MNLAVRLGSYLKPSILLNDRRLFSNHMRKYKITDFKLEVYIFRDGYQSKDISHILSLVLALEQWYILTVGTLNTIKVAGSSPVKNHSDETKRLIGARNSKPVWIYSGDELVFQCNSVAELCRLTGIGRSTINFTPLKPDCLIYGKLLVTITPTSDDNLLSLEAFLQLVEKARASFQTRVRPHLSSELQQLNNTQKIPVIALDLATGLSHSEPSIASIMRYLHTLGCDRYASHESIKKSMLTKRPYKGWLFSAN